jgi:microcystin-dependent protein
MSEPFLGEVRIFGCNFPPRGWAYCWGQLLPISQNTALFSILGTTYGGNGTTNFALPDFRGRVPLGQGQGPGLSSYVIGEQAGSETVTLISTELPAHNHTTDTRNVPTSADNYTNVPTTGYFVSRFLYHSSSAARAWKPASAPATTLHPNTLQPTGGNQPHNNMQPYLALNFCIAYEGIFPARN